MKKMIVNPPLSAEDAVKNGNSSTNQDIKGQFVSKHVFCNVNSLVEYCLAKGYEDSDSPVNIDSIENYSSYPEYRGEYANFEGGGENDINDEIDRLNEILDDLDQSTDEGYDKAKKLGEEIDELSRLEMETQEIYEWWAVSDYLYEKLRLQGHPVVDTGSCYIWGRPTTGQAILLDGVITRICADMGILDGQVNSWAKRGNS